MATNTTWTVAEYLALDEPDGPHFELSEGELLMSPSTTFTHNELRHLIEQALRAYFGNQPRGFVTSETDFLLGPATIRRPDVAVILAPRFRPEYRNQIPIPVAPDLAIEVVSTHDRPGALEKKTSQFLAAGTQAVWRVYSERREAQRFSPASSAADLRRAALGQALDEPSLLPGFTLALTELFPPEPD
ncbi:MAG: Uma2 family endonuclease [Terriglobales bacterium]